jgi:WD40 repeat protein
MSAILVLMLSSVSASPEIVLKPTHNLEHNQRVVPVAISPDNVNLATAEQSGLIRIWSLRTGEQIASFKGHTAAVGCLKYSSDGKSLLSSGHDGKLARWDCRDYSLMKEYIDERAILRFQLINNEDSVSLACNFHVKMLKSSDFSPTLDIEPPRPPVVMYRSAICDHSGSKLIYGGVNGNIGVYSLKEGTTLLQEHGSSLHWLCLLPKDGLYASATVDGIIRIWNTTSPEPLASLRGHESGVSFVGISPDNKYLVSASNDQTVRFWNLDDFREVGYLKAHSDLIWSLCFSSDGKIMATASEDGTVKVWDAAKIKEILANQLK